MLWARRYILAGTAGVTCAAALVLLVFSFIGANDRSAIKMLAVQSEECSTLVAQPATAHAVAIPCKPFEMRSGNSITRGRTLKRSNLPLRSNQLTREDRAIRPPTQVLRPSL
jgi:hypothetical protein